MSPTSIVALLTLLFLATSCSGLHFAVRPDTHRRRDFESSNISLVGSVNLVEEESVFYPMVTGAGDMYYTRRPRSTVMVANLTSMKRQCNITTPQGDNINIKASANGRYLAVENLDENRLYVYDGSTCELLGGTPSNRYIFHFYGVINDVAYYGTETRIHGLHIPSLRPATYQPWMNVPQDSSQPWLSVVSIINNNKAPEDKQLLYNIRNQTLINVATDETVIHFHDVAPSASMSCEYLGHDESFYFVRNVSNQRMNYSLLMYSKSTKQLVHSVPHSFGCVAAAEDAPLFAALGPIKVAPVVSKDGLSVNILDCMSSRHLKLVVLNISNGAVLKSVRVPNFPVVSDEGTLVGWESPECANAQEKKSCPGSFNVYTYPGAELLVNVTSQLTGNMGYRPQILGSSGLVLGSDGVRILEARNIATGALVFSETGPRPDGISAWQLVTVYNERKEFVLGNNTQAQVFRWA